MSELEDKLNSILSDPKQMEQIAGLARSLMGGAGEPPAGPAPEKTAFDPGLLRRITQAMRGGETGREQALLTAMRPYLSEKRQGKLDRAMRLTRMAKLAKLAMGELEDGETL